MEQGGLYMYHYYDRDAGPFRSLSDLSDEEANRIQDSLKQGDNIYVRRDSDGKYMFYRRFIERRIREMFLQKGGEPQRLTPYYMVLGECEFCKSWYIRPESIRIPAAEFDMKTVSFTYGDSFPTFDPTHGDKAEYRQNVYTYDGILEIIDRYGWPQRAPFDEAAPYWKPGYVEAQVWSDVPVVKYRNFEMR